MMIFRYYVVVASNDLDTFQQELDAWSRKGYMLYQPIKFAAKGEPYRYLAVMEIARAEEE